ncbi:MAG: matrixin family metalloprotease [Deltaproteobacteria bacterium]|nr:matrixin family metalloprotease [Deltaproteobacteria bacterium]
MRRFHTAAVLAFLPVLGGWSGYVDRPSGNFIRWYEAEVPVWVDARGTEDVAGEGEIDASKRSIETWNAVRECVHPVLRYMGTSTGYLPGEPSSKTPETARNLVIWWDDMAEWRRRHSENAIALTTLYYEVGTGIADKFDIELADWAYPFSAGDIDVETDVENTVTHELGHALGLDHSQDFEATMYFKAPAGDVEKRTLAEDDVEGLCTIYAPTPVPEPLPDAPAPADAGDSSCPWCPPDFLPADHADAGGTGGGDGCVAGAGRGPGAVVGPALSILVPLVLLSIVHRPKRRSRES